MSRVAYKLGIEDNVEYSVEDLDGPAATSETDHSQKRFSTNRVLFFVTCIFVGAAFVVMTASSRSVLGGTFLFVGVLFAFIYAAREVRSVTIHRRL